MKVINRKLNSSAKSKYWRNSFSPFSVSRRVFDFLRFHFFIMISDAAVHAAFIEKIESAHRKKKIQCRYCLEFFKTKHTNRQRRHLIKCAAYFVHMKKNFSTNVITRSANIATAFTLQTLFFSIINKAKRNELNRLTAMTIYCDERPLSMFENSWMKIFFLKSISYKSSEKNRIDENLLNEAYARTKKLITRIIDSSSMLNIVMNENDNQTKKRILNMCVLIQNHQSFHVISKSTDSMQLNARNEANWIIRQINDFTNDFFKICSFAIDTCSVQRSVWKHFIKKPRLKL